MSMLLKQSSTAKNLTFLLIDSTDHLSPKTGATPTVTLSKNGAAFAAPSGTVTEIGSGWYKVAGNATDTNTLGELIVHATATGADVADRVYTVVAFDPDSASSLGLTTLDAAITSRMASYTQPAGFLAATFPATIASTTNITSATGITVATNNDKTGYKLASDGLDTISTADVSSDADARSTFPKMQRWLFNRQANKVLVTSSQAQVFADDNSTVVSTMPLSDDGSTETKGKSA